MEMLEIMHAYNEYERKSNNNFSGEMIVSPEIVKLVSGEFYGSYIAFFDFDCSQVDKYIENEIQFFSNEESSFEWKVYGTDFPSNIVSALLRYSFVRAETESLMVQDLMATSVATLHHGFVEVKDEQGIRDAIAVQKEVWGGDFEWHYRYLLKMKTESPESISIYVVYVDEKPVASAWITFTPDSPFAGIWGGSTIKEYRGRGFYTLLLEKRISEAKLRGRKYIFIEASDMSKPIVEKNGFSIVTHVTGYHWNFKAGST